MLLYYFVNAAALIWVNTVWQNTGYSTYTNNSMCTKVTSIWTLKRSNKLKGITTTFKCSYAKFTHTCARIVNQNQQKWQKFDEISRNSQKLFKFFIFYLNFKKEKRNERSHNEVSVIPPLQPGCYIFLFLSINRLVKLFEVIGSSNR